MKMSHLVNRVEIRFEQASNRVELLADAECPLGILWDAVNEFRRQVALKINEVAELQPQKEKEEEDE